MATLEKIRIGTRKSPLALAQAEIVKQALINSMPSYADTGKIEIFPMQTTGDMLQAGTLSEVGGKGLFTKEIEAALLEHKVDIAVHSAKDMATQLPEGLIITAVLPREDARDVLISKNWQFQSIEHLPLGSCLGTASLRRQAQVANQRPDINIDILRGNVQTRLRRIEEDTFSATLLAYAGLKRLQITVPVECILPVDSMIPAVGQGVIALQCRENDNAIQELCAALTDVSTLLCLNAERALLAELDGSCRTPIAGYAMLDNESITLKGLLANPEGTRCVHDTITGNKKDVLTLGRTLGVKLRSALAEY